MYVCMYLMHALCILRCDGSLVCQYFFYLMGLLYACILLVSQISCMYVFFDLRGSCVRRYWFDLMILMYVCLYVFFGLIGLLLYVYTLQSHQSPLCMYYVFLNPACLQKNEINRIPTSYQKKKRILSRRVDVK